MNRQQLVDVVKGLLVAGGPGVVILTKLFHMEAGAANDIIQGLAALVSVAGIVWLAVGRSDPNMVKDAASVKGVQVHVDTLQAPAPVVEAARTTTDVVPMTGPPVPNDASKLG